MRATWSLGIVCLLYASLSLAQTPRYVDLGEVSEEGRALFDDLTSVRPSPCGDAETMIDAINKDAPCLLAVARGRVIARMLRNDSPKERIESFLDKLEASDKKPPTVFDLNGVAGRGPEKAPVVIVEFADYECPYCGDLEPILEAVIQRHQSWVRHYFINFPLTQLHPNADVAARAALAAKRQNKFWEMHDLLYARQAQLDAAHLSPWAKELGLNVEQFEKDLASPEVAAELAAELDRSTELHLEGTPALFINGRFYEESRTEEALENAIAYAYADATQDTKAFLTDPATAVRLEQRAALSHKLFWAATGAMSLLLILFVFLGAAGIFPRVKQDDLVLGVPPNRKATIAGSIAGVAMLGLAGHIVMMKYILERHFGPSASPIPAWLVNWVMSLGISVVIGVGLGLALASLRKKS